MNDLRSSLQRLPKKNWGHSGKNWGHSGLAFKVPIYITNAGVSPVFSPLPARACDIEVEIRRLGEPPNSPQIGR